MSSISKAYPYAIKSSLVHRIPVGVVLILPSIFVLSGQGSGRFLWVALNISIGKEKEKNNNSDKKSLAGS